MESSGVDLGEFADAVGVAVACLSAFLAEGEDDCAMLAQVTAVQLEDGGAPRANVLDEASEAANVSYH